MPSDISPDEELRQKIKELEKKARHLEQYLSNQACNEENLQKIANKLSLLADTDEMLIQQFSRNMMAFKQYYPDIYHYFENYQPTEFFIDIREGFANIFEQKTQQYIYQYPSYLMAMGQLESYEKHPQSTQSAFLLNEENEGNFSHSFHLNNLINLLHKREQANDGQVRSLVKDISSMIIFGIGCGHHIDLLVASHNFSSLYIIEPDLDIFYASLYCTNWAGTLAKLKSNNTNVHISLGPQEDDFFEDLLKQSYINGRYDAVKTFGYIHYKTPAITQLVSQYQTRFYEMLQGWGFFDDAVMSISHLLGNLKQQVPVMKKNVQLPDELADTPIFIVGNGPSLDDSIDVIRANQDKALIISCGSALSALNEYGITADFHCEQERTFPVAEKIDYYCPKEVIDKLVLLAPTTVHPAVFEKFNRALMAAKGNEPSSALLVANDLGKSLFDIHNYINPTVANTALTMAHGMGFKNVYLFGIDMGFKRGSNHHSKKSFYYEEEEDRKIYEEEKGSTITVTGNFGGTFICDTFFNMSRKLLERLIRENDDINCINLSDGALIKGTTPKQANTFSLSGKALNKKEVLATVLNAASYQDNDGRLYNSVHASLAYKELEELCEQLIAVIDKAPNSSKSAIEQLRQHTDIIRATKLYVSEHLYLLLNGSIMHMQAMLTRILYEALDEDVALEDFAKGLEYYKDFLREVPKYYQDNATQPHYMDTQWLTPFRQQTESF